MESGIEDQTLLSTSNEALSTLRELSIQCRELLQQLSAKNDPADDAHADELAPSFNIWMANMGVFREGRQSLEARLKSAPQVSELVRKLLVVLKRDLERKLLEETVEADSLSDNDSDYSSDRSTTYQLHASSGEDDATPSAEGRLTTWSSIQDTLTNLRQLALTIHLMGTQHRQARIERFKNLDRNKQVYKLFNDYAQQKVNYTFPNASLTLKQRMAESIGTRRARFMYLMQHQIKTSKSDKQSSAPPRNNVQEEEGSASTQEEVTNVPIPQHVDQQPSLRASLRTSAVLSSTTVTGLDPNPRNPKRAESVSSIRATVGKLPSRPKLAPGATSFTCPYCFLVFPVSEFSGQSQWMNHLIHDFEPFFCVIDDCSSPFSCADTYTAWISHMRDTHTQPEWKCWHCKAGPASSSTFSSSAELESHLEMCHPEQIDGPLRSTSIKYSKIHNQHPLEECPFCTGFPEEIETKYPTRDCEEAHEALEKHVRDHLISVAMILAPVESGESGDHIEDVNTEAESDIGSERDLEGVGDIHELECEDPSCDCKDTSKSSIPDWPIEPKISIPSDGAFQSGDLYRLEENLAGHGKFITPVTEVDFLADFDKNNLHTLPPDEELDLPDQEVLPYGSVLDAETIELHMEAPTTTPTINSAYLPLGKLIRFSHSSVVRATLLKTATLDNLQIDGLVDYVSRRARRLFVVLVLIGKLEQLGQLCTNGLADHYLPLLGKTDQRGMVVCGHKNQPLDSLSNWKYPAKLSLLTRQWSFMAPAFIIDRFEYSFLEEQPLPFRAARGDDNRSWVVGLVHKVEIPLREVDKVRYRTVAVKYLPKSHNENESMEFYQREKNMLKAMRQLGHPHLIETLAVFERGNDRGIVFPWAGGGNLLNLWLRIPQPTIDEGRLDWAMFQMEGLLSGIAQLHDKHIRHGDLKPVNILCFATPDDENGILKIADIGFKSFHAEFIDRRRISMEQKYGGSKYQPPEAEEPSQRSRKYDMWSLGCIFFEFLIWLTLGQKSLLDFFDHFQEHEQNSHFWENNPKQLRPVVRDWMNSVSDFLEEVPSRNLELEKMLQLVEHRLLRINVEDRATARQASEQMQILRRTVLTLPR